MGTQSTWGRGGTELCHPETAARPSILAREARARPPRSREFAERSKPLRERARAQKCADARAQISSHQAWDTSNQPRVSEGAEARVGCCYCTVFVSFRCATTRHWHC